MQDLLGLFNEELISLTLSIMRIRTDLANTVHIAFTMHFKTYLGHVFLMILSCNNEREKNCGNFKQVDF
jgi:hypothetical protein